MPTGGAGGANPAKVEAARQARINAGVGNINKAFSGFDDNFFNGRRQDYVNFALPQEQQQYDTTRKNLAYSLARNGLSNSSASVNENQSLTNTKNQKISDIVSEGQNQSNQLRSQVATQKGNVTNQLLSSADPSLANESALTATAGLAAQPAYAPIGNLFSDFSQQYLNNLQAKSYSNSNQSGNFGSLAGLFQ